MMAVARAAAPAAQAAGRRDGDDGGHLHGSTVCDACHGHRAVLVTALFWHMTRTILRLRVSLSPAVPCQRYRAGPMVPCQICTPLNVHMCMYAG
jgi:hypothetical protein